MQFPNRDLADRPTAHGYPGSATGDSDFVTRQKTLSRKGKIEFRVEFVGKCIQFEASNTYGEGGGMIIFRAGSD